MGSNASLDQFDIKILAHLQREGRCSNVELADAVGLSPSPCLVRTKRMREMGVKWWMPLNSRSKGPALLKVFR